jgi:hypothetical protein
VLDCRSHGFHAMAFIINRLLSYFNEQYRIAPGKTRMNENKHLSRRESAHVRVRSASMWADALMTIVGSRAILARTK